MGFLEHLGLVERRSHPRDPALWLQGAWGGPTASGAKVSQASGLSANALYSGIRLLAVTLASLPFRTYLRRPVGGGKDAAPEHPTYEVVHDEANPEQDAMEFRTMQEAYRLYRGNCYAEIVRDNGGALRELWPIPPWRMRIRRPTAGGQLRYYVRIPSGQLPGPHGAESDTGQERMLAPEQVLHLRGWSENGVTGMDPLEVQRETIGLSLALQESAARFFGNGAQPGGYLKTDKRLKPEAKKKIQEQWNATHQGLENQHRTALLEDGIAWVQLMSDPEKAQLIDSRVYSLGDVARMLNLPPHMIGDLEHATFSNVEQQFAQFAMITLRPNAVAWEKGCRRQLLTPTEKRRGYVFKHALDGLLRGDIESRYKALATAFDRGALSPDEWRELEDLNPLPNGLGRHYYVPLNMVRVDDVGDPPAPVEGDRGRRQRRSAASQGAELRRRYQRAHRRLYAAAAASVLEREANAVRGALRRTNGGRDEIAFRSWLDEYYRQHDADWSRELLPAATALAEVIHQCAADEVGAAAEADPDLARFVSRVVESIARRMAGSSRRQLTALLRESPEDPEGAIVARLDDWALRRPDRVAAHDTVQTGGAVAEFVFTRAGITTVEWVLGDDSPVCAAMAGRRVRTGTPFLRSGQLVQLPDADPFVTRGTIRHPPLQDGCECAISPVA